jgi:hypothetical protein
LIYIISCLDCSQRSQQSASCGWFILSSELCPGLPSCPFHWYLLPELLMHFSPLACRCQESFADQITLLTSKALALSVLVPGRDCREHI